MLLGNAQVPSVTVRERAKFAPEVARRFLSFSACGMRNARKRVQVSGRPGRKRNGRQRCRDD
jgi:hypothetical protein